MKLGWRALLLLLLGFILPLKADERLSICHGYGCLAEAEIVYSEGQLGDIRRLLRKAVDADSERAMLAEAIGLLYRWAGQQSEIRNDRAGNYADEGVSGRMDCIDHSTSTTRLLALLAARGYLRWHTVATPDVRYFALLVPVHWSAVIKEKEGDGHFVVDSWFVNNGEPAVILPLDAWKKGAGPDV